MGVDGPTVGVSLVRRDGRSGGRLLSGLGCVSVRVRWNGRLIVGVTAPAIDVTRVSRFGGSRPSLRRPGLRQVRMSVRRARMVRQGQVQPDKRQMSRWRRQEKERVQTEDGKRSHPDDLKAGRWSWSRL